VQYNTLDLIRPGLTNIQLSFSGIVLAENDSSGWGFNNDKVLSRTDWNNTYNSAHKVATTATDGRNP